jgi:predicted transposase/invertase (TIGR01784 family)
LFGDKRNIEILKDFLKSVLNLPVEEYEDITIDDTHIKRESKDDKLGIVDVKLTTKTGKIIHIELQVLEQDEFPERVLYYIAKILVTQIKSGEDYKFKKVISIVISDFEIIPDSPMYHHKFSMNDVTSGVNFTDIIEINTLELGKVSKESDNTKKHDWLQFLKAEREEEFDMLATKSPAINSAVVELKRLSQSEEARRIYEARQKAISDEKARTRTAHNKGHKNAMQEVVSNSIKIGFSNEQIFQITGVPITEIERMRNKLAKKELASA